MKRCEGSYTPFDVFTKPEEGEPEKTCHLTEGKALLWSS
jgi:hypothetical protein